MSKDKALEMAIEAMTSPNNLSFLMAITACKEALEYPSKQEILKTISDAVYAQYPKKKWNELSEVEINALVDFFNSSNIDIKEFIKKIERMSKEMNT